ncbi:MAG: hypothetical protein MRY76_10655 [Pseudomonadales bacterium]|nr:hypothetical protein [Pseudomonadales bacterium]
MKEQATETMSDKLFQLCEQQLLAIITDSGASIEKIVDSTTAAVEDSAILSGKIEHCDQLGPEEKQLCAGLESKVAAILTNMQCFDELSQRIEHISEIVRLIKLESDREGFLSDPKSSEELFRDISSIFSIRSEFEVLEKIFPESGQSDPGEMVELF